MLLIGSGALDVTLLRQRRLELGLGLMQHDRAHQPAS